jgi:GDP-4-dehydro-6-deoxy-D-mannose reductase
MVLAQESLPPDLADVPRHPGDITDAAAVERVLREAAPRWIFHLAAISHPGTCRENPSFAWEVNFFGTRNLYRSAARVVPEARVLFVGSAAEYGRPAPGDLPLTEDAPLRPDDVYAATKAAGDLLGADFARSRRLDVIRVRPFNHIGPGQGKGFVASDFASQIARIERGLQPPRIETGSLDAVRDFTDVRDVVRAYVLLMERGESGAVYNVCSGVSRSVRELLDGLLASSVVKCEIVSSAAKTGTVPTTEGRAPLSSDVVVGSAEALRAATGWEPRIPWQQTLAELLDDWRNRVGTQNPV